MGLTELDNAVDMSASSSPSQATKIDNIQRNYKVIPGLSVKENISTDREPFEKNLWFVVVERIRRFVHLFFSDELTLMAATWHCLRNHDIPGQATSGQLEAAALSVRVFYQSASTVPRCIHSVFPLARSNKQQRHVAAIKVDSSRKEDERNA